MSLVGFSAQNHPQQEIKDDIDDRRTLPDFFLPLHKERRFTVDAAASDENALLPVYWTKEQDALKQSWAGHRVWCNPPFSKLAPWLEKAWDEMQHNGCESVTMLLPANRCEQAFWQTYVEPWREGKAIGGVKLSTWFIPGRLRFGFPDSRPRPSKGDRPPFGCVLLSWVKV